MGQPMMGQPMMQPQQPMSYQPQQTSYAYTPNNMTQAATVAQPDPAAAPQVAPAQATTDGTTVNVGQTFQA
jgi:hypothetical protein